MGQKIIIIGNGGSGKSTLGARLGTVKSIPVIHLDRLTFHPGGKSVAEAEFRARLSEELRKDTWIIEGWSYQSTMAERFAASDTIIYLDYPIWYCYWNALKRNIHSTFRPDQYAPRETSLWKNWKVIAKAMWKVHTIYEPQVRKMIEEQSNGKFLYRFTSRREMKRKLLPHLS